MPCSYCYWNSSIDSCDCLKMTTETPVCNEMKSSHPSMYGCAKDKSSNPKIDCSALTKAQCSEGPLRDLRHSKKHSPCHLSGVGVL